MIFSSINTPGKAIRQSAWMKIQLSPPSPKPHLASFFNQKIRHLSVGKYYRFGHRVAARALYTLVDLDMVCGDPISNFIPAEICCSSVYCC